MCPVAPPPGPTQYQIPMAIVEAGNRSFQAGQTSRRRVLTDWPPVASVWCTPFVALTDSQPAPTAPSKTTRPAQVAADWLTATDIRKTCTRRPRCPDHRTLRSSRLTHTRRFRCRLFGFYQTQRRCAGTAAGLYKTAFPASQELSQHVDRTCRTLLPQT